MLCWRWLEKPNYRVNKSWRTPSASYLSKRSRSVPCAGSIIKIKGTSKKELIRCSCSSDQGVSLWYVLFSMGIFIHSNCPCILGVNLYSLYNLFHKRFSVFCGIIFNIIFPLLLYYPTLYYVNFLRCDNTFSYPHLLALYFAYYKCLS